MAFIRAKSEELTGYQEASPFSPSIDFDCDFVMVYGIDDTMPERIRQFREKGYVIHLMTGIAWGQYQDYLDGRWDNTEHWDEGQVDRNGKDVIHNPTVPYMCPSVAFSEYLVERLKIAVDNGVEAIHMEEPEYWDHSGYSEGFKREYEIFYKEPWKGQHESLDAHYKSAKLKAYLYRRTIERISASVKEYAKRRYKKNIRFYVPTHSLLNYTQWKIISPEAALIDIPTVDGYIAQIWTGTSREANVYNGIYKERTFETAYLEYGVMQELTRGTGRRMWFLNDPIEDRPAYTWENYEYNYIKTAAASLLHPHIWNYEICPWPHRVFEGWYPRYQPGIEHKDETSYRTEESKPIPQSYATLLSGMFQLFGDMEQDNYYYEGSDSNVGIFMSDSGLFQRTFPDGVVSGKKLEDRFEKAKHKNSGNPINEQQAKELVKEIKEDCSLMLDFIQSTAFPSFYGMALPLVKYGMPVKPVQLDNIRRFAGYLSNMQYLILSYEYIKPEGPDINSTIVSWVKSGGILIYIGDGNDPFHNISSWWRNADYDNPAQHLFEMAGMDRNSGDGVYEVGKGRIIVWSAAPAAICLDVDMAEKYRSMIKRALSDNGDNWEYRNDLTLHRGPYIISSVMDESINDERKEFTGVFSDLLKDGYPVIERKVIGTDECALLFDYGTIKGEKTRIIATAARIETADFTEDGFAVELKTADNISSYTRLRVPKRTEEISAIDEDGIAVDIDMEWDDVTETVLLHYQSKGKKIYVRADYVRS